MLGVGVPNGLQNLQSAIAGVTTHCLEKFFILFAHLDISNTSYGQKTCWESNWQFDSRPLKVGNRPDFLACRWHTTYHWKDLDKGYNLSLNLIAIRGLHVKLCALKVARVPTRGILGVLGQKAIWMWPAWRDAKYTIRG
jgi:hypothetical protein